MLKPGKLTADTTDVCDTYLCNHSFILNRIEGAGGVHQAAANLEHLAGMKCNAQLQGVQAIAIAGRPASPYVRSLADGAISATGDVT